MSHEAPKVSTKEQRRSAESLPALFGTAQRNLYKLLSDPALHAKLIALKINPYDDANTGRYWRAVSHHAQGRISQIRATHGSTPLLNAFELTAATPDFLYANHALDGKGRLEHPSLQDARYTVSHFNGLIRNFAVNNPSTKSLELYHGLTGVVPTTIEDPRLRNGSADMLQRHLNGMRQELGFGQILHYTGRWSRPTTVEEDLAGIDYVIQAKYSDTDPLRVNVKASVINVRNENGYNGFFAIKGGDILMCSPVRDADFQGGFFITDELAADWGPRLDAILTQAEEVRYAQQTVLYHSSATAAA